MRVSSDKSIEEGVQTLKAVANKIDTMLISGMMGSMAYLLQR